MILHVNFIHLEAPFLLLVNVKHYRQQFDVGRTEIEFERIGGGEPAEGVVFERLGLDAR